MCIKLTGLNKVRLYSVICDLVGTGRIYLVVLWRKMTGGQHARDIDKQAAFL